MEEREIIHWGVQCNRAVRILFPDMIMRSSKFLDNDKDDYLPVSFRDEDIKHSPYTINNPLLSYNPIAAQHNELALQYQSQLFNMWRFMSPFHPYPLQPGLGMMNLDNKSTLPKASICSPPTLNNHDVESPRDGYESPVLSVGSKSDLDTYMGGNSKSPIAVEETGQNATNCSIEERKDREVNILSVSPLPVVSS
ncbi:hypothetical protein LOTGIDRAFT_162312 [Lottia gigantea]|uniref:Uncharacterized protein n=1 Tax=Lottia gigantea TaxID=225164 RepID=V4AHI5_LOTGI|nr:hypothetical protein LOTGIDRAFT_162312 [Lottia gigantea]ESO92836.1 hypothetical protein LOTGIDRAFT_162312 [Lottia gigantea]